jgi:two-component system cell cycle sensor histidine kinase/response regulator CckA
MAETQVLIVEDDNIIAMDIKSRLQVLGYAVSAVVSSGQEAIEKAAETQPDLVLMDIRLRGPMDGVEAAERIRTRFDIPVVYLTAHADESTLQRAKLTEPYGYILKPFEERELHTAVEMALYKYKMEKRLKESERWLATLLRSIGDAVIATDVHGSVTFMNPIAEALTGWRQAEVPGNGLADVFRIMDQESSAVTAILTQVLQTGGVVHLTDRLLTAKDGSETPVDVSAAPIRDGRENIAGAVLAFRDITERKRAEKEKEAIQAQLLQAQKMEAVGLLAGGIAHDFNNLMTVIIGYSQLALSSLGDGDSLRESIEVVNRAGRRATSLTQQLLAFSRKQILEPKVLNLNTVVTGMGEMLRRLIGEDIELRFVLEPALDWVKADPGQIEQVIMNLVVNAREAMPEGGKIVVETNNVTLNQDTCQSMPEARPGMFVSLSVTDTGVGIDKENIGQIFEPFFSTKKVGTGLGLSVVYGIVKQHEGWIDVCSRPGQGSMFQIYLPSTSVETEQKPKEEMSLDELRGNGERILLVEDEESVRGFAATVLGEGGYVVFEAASAEQALDVFEREDGDFCLVFSDVVLPDDTGLQLADQLLAHNPELGILLCSGYTDEKSQWSAIQERGFQFLRKPYTLVDLLDTVKEVIELG